MKKDGDMSAGKKNIFPQHKNMAMGKKVNQQPKKTGGKVKK